MCHIISGDDSKICEIKWLEGGWVANTSEGVQTWHLRDQVGASAMFDAEHRSLANTPIDVS